jgi:hypothetical protein
MSAHSPEFVLVERLIIRADKERFYAHTSLQQILKKSNLQP